MNDRRGVLKHLGIGGILGLLSSGKTQAQQKKPSQIRGVVFIVSDGMSPGVLTLAQAFSQQIRKTDTCWWQLLQRQDTVKGLMDTASANSLVTDSAAASSSWGSGQRVNNGMINVTPNGKFLEPIAVTLQKRGIRTGLVSTATITHATPAGFAANVAKRDNEESIATQYLNRVDILLGGGEKFFDPAKRSDKKDLWSEYRAAGYEVARNAAELAALPTGKMLGVFSDGHLPFSLDRKHDESLKKIVPELAVMAAKALGEMLNKDQRFLLQIEGARVDHAAHLNDIAGLLHEQLALDDAIAVVTKMLAGRDDVLVIVTSDHGNSNPGLNGMGASYQRTNQHFSRIADISASFEKIQSDLAAGKITDIAAYIQSKTGYLLDQKEAKALRASIKNEAITEWNHLLATPQGLLGQMLGNHTGVGWTGSVHTSDPTLITAFGPESSRFNGLVKNSDVHGHLLEVLA